MPITRFLTRLSALLRPGVPQRRRRAKLWLGQPVDALENRVLLASFSWNTDADGQWENAANWIDDQGNPGIPGSNDSVSIDRGAASPTITISSNVTVASLSVSEHLVLDSGQLRGDTSITIAAGGELKWRAGMLRSPAVGVAPGGTLTIDTAARKEFIGRLTNAGTVSQLSPISSPARSSSFVNEASGDWTMADDFRTDDGFSIVFTNSGTFRKSSSSAATFRQYDLFDHRAGSELHVDGGSLQLPGSGSQTDPSTGARIDVAAGAVLYLTNDRTSYFVGSWVGTGEGRVELAEGTLNLQDGNGGTGVTFDFAPGLFHWTGGVISTDGSTGDPAVNAGEMTWSGSGTRTLWGQAFRNEGTIVQTDDGITDLASGGAGTWLFNAASGVIDDQGTGSITRGRIFNSGVLRNSSGDTEISSQLNVEDGGRIESLADRLWLSYGGEFGTSVLHAAGSGVIELNEAPGGAHFQISDGATLSGTGDGRVLFSQGRIESLGGNSTINFADGQFHWTGGEFFRDITNAGHVTISGTDSKRILNGFRNEGRVIHSAGSHVNSSSTGFTNAVDGYWEMQGDASFGGASFVTAKFLNSGILRKTGPGIARIDDGGVALSHQGGRVEVREGDLVANHTNNAESTGGLIDVAAGSTLEITNSLYATGTLTGSGEGTLLISAEIRGGVTLDFPEGMATLAVPNSDQTHSVTNRGWLTIDHQGVVQKLGWLNNEGTIVQTSGTDVEMRNYSLVTNAGTWELQGDASISFHAFDGLAAYFVNTGTLRKTGPVAVSSISSSGNAAVFSNNGSVEVLNGTLEIHPDHLKQYDAWNDTLHGGAWYVGAFATLSLVDNDRFEPPIVTNHADVVLDGEAAAFPNLNSLAVNGGSLTVSGGRDFTAPGSLTVGVERVSTELLEVRATASGRFVGIARGNGRLYTHSRNERQDGEPIIRQRDPETHAEIADPIIQPGGPVGVSGLDVTTAAVTVGGVSVPAGTLLFIHGEQAPPTLYAISADDGRVLASQPLTDVDDDQVGVAWHPGRGTVFTVGQNSTISEVDPADGSLLASFSVRPSGTPWFSIGSWGGLDVLPNGDLILVGSSGQRRLRILTPTGDYVNDVELANSGMYRDTLSDISVDDATGDILLASENGYTFRFAPLRFGTTGELTVGAGSVVDVTEFTSGSDNVLRFEVAGPPESDEYGRLIVAGDASFGQIAVVRADGFGPALGDQYPIATYAARTGDLPAFAGLDRFFSAAVASDGITLTGLLESGNLDIAAASISAPSAANVGESVTVSWTVSNLTTSDLTGSWTDSVYLSRDDVLDPTDILLGRRRHAGGVDGLASYNGSLTAAVPGLIPANYRPLIVVDSRREVSDIDRSGNQAAATDAISIGMPSLTFDTPVNGGSAADGRTYWKLPIPDQFGDVLLTIDAADLSGLRAFASFGEIPTRSQYHTTSSASGRLVLTEPAAGDWYVMLHSQDAVPSWTVTATQAPFEFRGFSPSSGSNQGRLTVRLDGQGFRSSSVVTLRDAADAIVATADVYRRSSETLFATFDLVGISAGEFRIAVADASGTITQSGFTVTAEAGGELRHHVSGMNVLRPQWRAPLYIFASNIGQSDVATPLVAMVTQSGQIGGYFSDDRFPSLLITREGRRDVIGPGERATLVTHVQIGSYASHVFDTSRTEPFDVASREAGLRREDLSDTSWNAVWSHFAATVGTTMGSLTAALGDASQHALELGQDFISLQDLESFILSRSLLDAPGASLYGTLSDADTDAPIAGTTVLLRSATQTFATQTWYDGRFSLWDVPAGSYDIVLPDLVAPARSINLPDEPLVDLTARPGSTVSGVVATGSSGPLEAAAITLTSADGTTRRLTASDEDGLWSLSGLPAGEYRLTALHENTVPYSAQLTVPDSVMLTRNIALSEGRTVTGTVRGPGGELVTGATVLFSDGENSVSAVSGPGGTFEVSALDRIEYSVQADAGGYGPQTLTLDDTSRTLDVTLTPANTLNLTVTDSGVPVAGATITVIDSLDQHHIVTTDAGGIAQVSDLPAGDAQIVVTTSGSLTALRTTTLSSGGTVDLSIGLARSTSVTGTILSSTAQTPDVEIQLIQLNPIDGSTIADRRVYVDDDGVWQFDDVQPGPAILSVAGGIMTRSIVVPDDGSVLTEDFTLSYGTLRGRVIDGTGNPLPDQLVQLYANDEPLQVVLSDPDGLYEFDVTGSGPFHIVVADEQSGFLRSGPVVPVIDAITSVPDLQAGTHSLSVTVTAAGSPIDYSAVFIRPILAGGFQMPEQMGSTVDGPAAFANLPAGRYEVLAIAENWIPARVEVDIPAASTVSLQVQPGFAMTGQVTDAAEPAAGIRVVLKETTTSATYETVTDESGNYAINGLASGTYRVLALRTGSEDAPQLIAVDTVNVSGPATADLALAPGRTITGTVSAADLTVLADVLVIALDATGAPLAESTVQPNGDFTLDGLPEGEVTVLVIAEGRAGVSLQTAADTVSATLGPVLVIGAPVETAVPEGGFQSGWAGGGDELRTPSLDELVHVWINRDDGVVEPNVPQKEFFDSLIDLTVNDINRRISAKAKNGDLCASVGPAVRNFQAILRARESAFSSYQAAYDEYENVRWEMLLRPGARALKIFGSATLLAASIPAVATAAGFTATAAASAASFAAVSGLGLAVFETGWSTVLQPIINSIRGVNPTSPEELNATFSAYEQISAPFTALRTKALAFLKDEPVDPAVLKNKQKELDALMRRQRKLERDATSRRPRTAKAAQRKSRALDERILKLSEDIQLLENSPTRAALMEAAGQALDYATFVLDTITSMVNATREIQVLFNDYQQRVDLVNTARDLYEQANGRYTAARNAVFAELAKSCPDDDDTPPPPDGKPKIPWLVRPVFSFDPNDILGPAGFDEPEWIISDNRFPYMIRYENIDTATAPAQIVSITQQLDPSLDLTTFEFGSFGWSDIVVSVPPGRDYYQTRVDAVESSGLLVDFEATLDHDTRIASWTLTSIDPDTLDFTNDPLAGFLPPNRNGTEGQGFVEYSVTPKRGLADGTSISAEARIVFDTNDPIDTPVYTNTIDDTAPTSHVTRLPEFSSTRFEVNWAADDGAGSGAQTFDVYSSRNGGPFELWLDDTPHTSATFEGSVGDTWSFHSVATDGVDLQESPPAVADTSTTIVDIPFHAPAATTPDVRPQFLWDAVPDASRYEIWIKNLSTNENPFRVGTATTNAWQPDEPLGIGRFRVWRRSFDQNDQPSPWTTQYTFRVDPVIATAPMPRYYPDATPTIQWDPVVGAETYELWIDNLTTGERQFVWEQTLTDTTWTAPGDWTMGVYRIWVRARDAAGIATSWQSMTEIVLRTQPMTIGPSGPTFVTQPTFRWQPVVDAAHYEVMVTSRVTGQTVIRETNLSSPEFTPATDLARDSYRWWALAVSDRGIRSLWSDPTDVTIGGRTELTAPQGTPGTDRPTFEWLAVQGAGAASPTYDLWVDRVGGPSRVLLETGLTQPQYTPEQPLAPGTYRAWVRAVDGSQMSAWSRVLEFLIQ